MYYSVSRCPFPLQLDMCDIIDHFVHLELRVHALSCALMMPIPEDQEKAVMVHTLFPPLPLLPPHPSPPSPPPTSSSIPRPTPLYFS